MAQIGTYFGHPVYDEDGGPLDDDGFAYFMYGDPPQSFIPTDWPASGGVEIGSTEDPPGAAGSDPR